MKNWNPEVNLYERNRQSPVAIILILVRLIVRLTKQFWPILLVFLFRRGNYEGYWLNNVVIVLGLGSAIISIISYFKFYFYIKGEELVIEKGVFQKSKINVPFDRIQTVNLQQNPIHRFFDVMALEIDTAGSAGKELSITAINRKNAEEIRSFLLEKSRAAKAERNGELEEEEDIQTEAIAEKALLGLSVLDLIKIGIGQNHIRRALILIASIFGMMEYASTIIGGSYEDQAKQLFKGIEGSVWGIVAVLVLFMVSASVLLTLVQTVLRYYNLKFLKTERGFKVVAGLITRREQSANLSKIQQIRWTNNPVKSLFKLFDLKLSQAASTVVGLKQAFYVPGCYEHHVDSVKEAYYPGVGETEFEKYRIQKVVIWRRFLYIGLVPFLLLSLNLYLSTNGFPLWPILWLVLVFAYQYRYWYKWQFALSEDGLQTRSGVIGTNWNLLLWYKVQSVKIKQTIYQRRKGLCNLVFYTAAGGIVIPYIKHQQAQKIRDYVLYKIESSRKTWM